MPRPQKPGAPPPKRRSRNGCWNCKRKKIKCDETHPKCSNCVRIGDECDYSVQLKWGGRQKRKKLDDQQSQNQHVLSFGHRPATAEASSSSHPPGSPLPLQRPHSSPLPALPSRLLNFTSAEYVPALTLPPAQMPLSGDEYTFSPSPTLDGRSTFPLHPYPLASAAILTASVDSTPRAVASPSAFAFDATSYQHPPIQPPRKRLKLEPRKPGVFSVLQMELPAPASESSHATPRLNSLPSLLSSTASTVPTPDRICSPQGDGGGDGEGEGSDEDFVLMSPGLRRMSGPVFPAREQGASIVEMETRSLAFRERRTVAHRLESPSSVRCWGVDRGSHDWDLGLNDDEHALVGDSPIMPKDQSFPIDVLIDRRHTPPSFAFGARSSQEYYDEPIHIIIPDSLSPIPDNLLQNRMNLLYFHHFLNHTARVLVPHDDPQSNPFRTVLPQLALGNNNLLNLLLAFSAAHRARHLGYPEPRLRILTYVQDILPSLLKLVIQVVDEPETVISTADLATAIMMASLEIISPASLGVVKIGEEVESIPWQSHLRLAREIIAHRPGGLRRKRSDDPEDQACAFLWSWFAYLDVLGSLSGGRGQLGSPCHWMLDCEPGGQADGVGSEEDSDENNQIDCIMGFTPRCVYILAKISELVRSCEAARDCMGSTMGQPDWRPDEAVAVEAIKLREAVERSLARPSLPCRHVHATADVVKWDTDQMTATNEAYHWAALIHLHRRVLGLPSDHEDIQVPVGKILACLEKIEHGGTAETCLLFPMFTAGCELTDEDARQYILDRIRTVEETGMTQVSGARKLMEKVWREGQPWETLLSTEFIG